MKIICIYLIWVTKPSINLSFIYSIFNPLTIPWTQNNTAYWINSLQASVRNPKYLRNILQVTQKTRLILPHWKSATKFTSCLNSSLNVSHKISTFIFSIYVFMSENWRKVDVVVSSSKIIPKWYQNIRAMNDDKGFINCKNGECKYLPKEIWGGCKILKNSYSLI